MAWSSYDVPLLILRFNTKLRMPPPSLVTISDPVSPLRQNKRVIFGQHVIQCAITGRLYIQIHATQLIHEKVSEKICSSGAVNRIDIVKRLYNIVAVPL